MNCPRCIESVALAFQSLRDGQEFRTPDNIKRRAFSVTQIDQDFIIITTEGGADVRISRDAFYNALHYLHHNNHNQDNPCDIRSSDDTIAEGPLCEISRTNNVRCITYILPILAANDIVGINGRRLNNTWFI